ncbi:MAG TPA: hypothetical protein PKW07_04420 [Syntrophorhabdaceae bacterium]|nr:hypothetical protein [Syntrophorhabdaceae bacterium]
MYLLRVFAFLFLSFLSAGLCPAAEKAAFIQLSDLATGRVILSQLSTTEELITLTWNNSQFSLKVTEVYIVREGFIEQTAVTFHDPEGKEPPLIKPEEIGDFYHTGGPFRAEGISRRFKKVIFRIGDFGNPILKIAERSINLKKEVGFGGAVVIEILDGY